LGAAGVREFGAARGGGRAKGGDSKFRVLHLQATRSPWRQPSSRGPLNTKERTRSAQPLSGGQGRGRPRERVDPLGLMVSPPGDRGALGLGGSGSSSCIGLISGPRAAPSVPGVWGWKGHTVTTFDDGDPRTHTGRKRSAHVRRV